LVKVKKDKEKAVRLIIQLIGKEQLNDFMQQHAGSPDILDSMMLAFDSSTLTSNQRTSTLNRSGVNANTSSSSSKARNPKAAATRSRMDEYFKTVVIQNDI
jgi:hypothetical protein